MNAGTDYVTLDKRITRNDPHSAVRWAGASEEDDTTSGGWTWLAALLVAALFIVSGYLDQEAGLIEAASTSAVAERYASSTSAPQAMVAGTNGADRQADKGY